MNNLKVSEKMIHVFGKGTDKTLTLFEIKEMVLNKYPDTNPGSIIPSDYCYNIINKHPNSFKFHLFEFSEAGKYIWIGLHYSYNGDITWKERIVGHWNNGKCIMTNDPRII